jgi:GNAT superfamily N-acetyltransferase
LAICRFGEAHIRPHYAPLIDAEPADEHPQHRGRGVGPQLLAALTGQLPANAGRLYIKHFVANERAGGFYEREGFTVEQIESSPTEDPALGVVWRARHLAPFEQTNGHT